VDLQAFTFTLIALVAIALVFDFMNGFHDAANSIATVVSTGVLRPYQAVIWAAFFNFVAIFIFHLKVAAMVGKGIVDPVAVDHYVIFGALIGAIAGVLVVGSVLFFDKVKIDDPVGAVSVHGICGFWGLVSVGLFATYDDAFLGREDAGLFYGGGIDQLLVQLLMAAIILVWVVVCTGILFGVLKATIGLRVSREEEVQGLDVLEHGLQGYAPDMAHTS